MTAEILLNLEVGKYVCIDWDIFFKDFEQGAIPYTASLLRFARKRLKQLNHDQDIPFTAYYQRSASDNVHLKLKFDIPLTILDAFLIRAWMGDDRTRLQLDAARYFRNGSLHEMNQCFDHKIKHDGQQFVVRAAGKWIRLDYENDKSDYTTAEAHTKICNMQDECLKRKRQDKQKALA